MREIRPSGSMSGKWKRSMMELVRHRQTKEPETDRPHLNHRATSRLYRPSCRRFWVVTQLKQRVKANLPRRRSTAFPGNLSCRGRRRFRRSRSLTTVSQAGNGVDLNGENSRTKVQNLTIHSSDTYTRFSVPVIPANESVSMPKRCNRVMKSWASGSSSTWVLLCHPASESIPAPVWLSSLPLPNLR